MRNLGLILTATALLVGLTPDYSETRSNAKAAVELKSQVAKLKEDLIVLKSHWQSRFDEARARARKK